MGIANHATTQIQKSVPSGEVVVSLDQLQNRFIQEALQAHNYYRQLHGVDKVKMLKSCEIKFLVFCFKIIIFKKKLTHNSDLSRMAQNYAIHLAKIKSLVHSKSKYKNEPLGENLAFAYDSRISYYSG